MTADNIMKVVKDNRKRRCNDPVTAAGWHVYSSSKLSALETAIWINDFTTGRYYMALGYVAFQDEADAIMFALSQ